MAWDVLLIKTSKKPSPDDIEKSTLMLLRMIEKRYAPPIKGSSSILIKPNVTMDKPWETGVTTCPYVVKGLIRWCMEKGADEILIGEGSMIGVDTMKAFEVCGFMELADELSVGLVDLNREPTVKVKVPKGMVVKELRIAKRIFDVDLLIDVAKLKTHILTLVSLGMKNLKGVLPYEGKRLLHFLGLEGGIVDLNSVVKPDLVIIEGIIGQEGLGPLSGDPVEADILIGSKGVVEVDAITSALMGIDPWEVAHLKLAHQKGLGDIDVNLIKVYGSELSALRRKFRRPFSSMRRKYPGVEIINGEACSGCMGAIMVALNRMQRSGELTALMRSYGGLTIIVGPRATPPRKYKGLLVVCGKCLLRFRDKGVFIPGCPPQGLLVRDLLRMRLGLKPLYTNESLLKEAERAYGIG
ncbi:MAG: DUF362 domain-containing protein [Thermoprotei archaeon]|nr:DUF362 domain-containing protein [Thermoprotei archaeon]